jgi:hypothetical protein
VLLLQNPAVLLLIPLTSFLPFQNGELNAAGIIAVYTNMLGLRSYEVKTKRRSSTKERDTLMSRAQSQRLIIPTIKPKLEAHVLAPELINNVKNWVTEQKQGHGKLLDKQAFVKAVCGLAGRNQNEKHNPFLALFSPRNLFYGPAILLFTLGGLWALLAVGAMNERFLIRHDIDMQQMGTLHMVYFAAGISGPFIGGYIMDNYGGPGLVVSGFTSITTIGAVLQWLANTPERFVVTRSLRPSNWE